MPSEPTIADLTVAHDVDGIVTAAARAAFVASDEIGMQVVVCLGDDLIVDVNVGYADRERAIPVRSTTLFPVFSVTKGVVATAVHRCVEDGVLDLDTPIGAYWPQFAQHGKSSATLAHALTHSVGIPAMPDGCTVEQMCDWEFMVDAVAAMAPNWRPGTATGYHAYTFGWIVGEVLRRAHGGSDPVTVVNEALGQFGVQDFWVGLPPEHEDRVATLYAGADWPRPGTTELFERALPAVTRPQPGVFNRPDVHRACLPAAGGIGTAGALARLYGRLAAPVHTDAGRDGARPDGPLTAATIRTASALRTDAEDLVLGHRVRKGLGFWLGGPENPQTLPMGDGATFGHPGSGGSIAWADIALGAGIAITKNFMAGAAEPSILRVADAARAAAVRAREKRDSTAEVSR